MTPSCAYCGGTSGEMSLTRWYWRECVDRAACDVRSAQEVAEQARACVEVVDHPGEMGPHRDDFCVACGTIASVDLIDADGWCEKCAADDCGGYTSRGDAHLMAVTAPGAR